MIRFLSLGIVTLILVVTFWPVSQTDKRILFIGNSFTFGGNVPLQVQNIALTAAPSVRYEVVSVVRGGTTLQEHIMETAALETIRLGGWDVVVLQDASVMSFTTDRRRMMRDAATILAREAQEQGAKVLYFAHWSPGGWEQEQDLWRGNLTIDETYRSIVQQTGGHVAHAGLVWFQAHEAGMDGLYSPDGHHSSVKGAWAAALAIVAALGDTDPGTSTWSPLQNSQKIPDHKQELLRRIASDLIDRVQ